MSFDFKKEYKEFYMPKRTPEIVNIPKANYIAVRGAGDPNEEGGDYKRAISMLYSVAFTLKMSQKSGHDIEGFFDYVVPPLEGFWWQEYIDKQDAKELESHRIDYSRKSDFHWISVIRLPDFIKKDDFEWAIAKTEKKKKMDLSKVEFLTIDEGLCVQIMHVGSYDDEPESIALMDAYLEAEGYVNDFSDVRLHHEIYLSDARKVEPQRRRTVIRHPIKER